MKKLSRHDIREHLFRELFLREFYSGEEFDEQCARYRDNLVAEAGEEGGAIAEPDLAELRDKAAAVADAVPELDEAIDGVSEGWKTTRMGKVELTILRLAWYEMSRDDSVPVRVAINEAVELAKTYGGEDSPAFVNAILGKLAKKLPDGEGVGTI